jgi:seryl-tRNA synthetase
MLSKTAQDNRLFYQAVKHYDREHEIEYLHYVPTAVDVECIKATASIDRATYAGNDKWLVGSAEQSFLQLIKDEQIQPGRYQAITECFRPHDKGVSPLHHGIFRKLELISIDCDGDELSSLCQAAKACFKELAPYSKTVLVVTNEGFDLRINGIEVGSYGRRQFRGVPYVYATGLALPRFTDATNYTS